MARPSRRRATTSPRRKKAPRTEFPLLPRAIDELAPSGLWTLGLLAGGYSRRFGRDKSRVPILGATLLDHAVARLARPETPVLVATREGAPAAGSGWPWVADRDPGAGPLAGTLALLSTARTPWVLVVACDQPCLPPDLAARLLGALHAGDEACALRHRRDAAEPLPVLLHRDLAARLAAAIDAGARRMNTVLTLGSSRILPLDQLYMGEGSTEPLANVNTPDDLARATAALLREGAGAGTGRSSSSATGNARLR